MQKRELERDPRLRTARKLREMDVVRVLDNGDSTRSGTSSRRQGQGTGSRRQSQSAGGQRQGQQVNRSARNTQNEVTGRKVQARQARRQVATKAKNVLSGWSRLRVALIALLVLVLAGVGLYFSPVFRITNIEVSGNWHLSSARLTELAHVSPESTLLRVDTDAITQRILADPWVKTARVTRGFPAMLKIEVSERQPVAVVTLAGADAKTGANIWLVSSDGVWLGELLELQQSVQAIDEATALRISGLADDQQPPVAGAAIQDPGLLNAIAAINGFSSPMRSMINWISAPNVSGMTLYLNNNVEVAFGTAEDIAAKELVINEMIAQHGNNLLRINVRVVDRASYSAAE